MEWPHRNYQCSVCTELVFKSRSDWLVHLVLGPHSLKVLQNFEQWKAACKADLYVISGLDNVENSMLVEYISDNVHTFADIVFFKPKADICIIVGDTRELDAFSARQQHYIGRAPIKFKAYKQIGSLEWKSYFHAEPSNEATESGPLKRKLDETSQCSSAKSIKLTHNTNPGHSQPVQASPQSQSGRDSGHPNHVIDTNGGTWEEDLEKLQNYIFMSNEQIESRKNIIKHLTDLFRKSHPNCKVIPVGADILGFNLDQTVFTIYFDSNGFTEAKHVKPNCVIPEATNVVDKIRTSVFVKLKSLQTEGQILSNVQCHGANCIRFHHVLFDIQCNLLLRPFMLAQTARLCKQLYSMDERVAALLNMVTYWAMQHQHFSEVGLTNPYVIYWLVYFFFMKKSVLPPVVELQKSCPYEIVDGQNNVAFSYDETVFADVISPHRCQMENAKSQIEMLLEWFIFMDDAFGETNGKGENRRHSLVCLRFGELIDKRKFTVCWEAHRDKKKTLTSQQKKVRRLWKENLTEIGFPEEMWGNLLGLKLPDTLSVQHPLYISENISLAFEGPFSKRFFKAVKETREKLMQLLSGNASVSSLLVCLSDFGL